MNIEVYSDGSGTVATKPGGYGYVVVVDGIKAYEGSGHLEFATNNDCELQGAIEGLYSVAFNFGQPEEDTQVTLVSDSQIILNWANGTNRFTQKEKMDKYLALINLMGTLSARTRWVPGHSGQEHNERCDKLANAARKKEVLE